ncbi:MAG: DAK2 domain-containing protein [Bacillota bacterium]
MDTIRLSGAELANFFIGGSAYLSANKEQINALNVFPVPDGDTGTNMGLTLSSAVKNIKGLNNAGEVAAAVAKGALMGARGNSGVITSQILRGFSTGLDSKEDVDALSFAEAMQNGVDLAYKSVMRPVEGTILTVSKAMAKKASEVVREGGDVVVLIEMVIEAGKVALDNTPNQLPQLKAAGVVDAGGQGLICIFEGGLKALRGEEFTVQDLAPEKPDFTAETDVDDKSDLKYHYCTEFFIHGTDINVDEIREHLADMGDSQVIVGNEELVKTHIHTDDPGKVLSYALTFGSLHDLKIENMKDQHRETIFTEEEVKAAQKAEDTPVAVEYNCGVVAVASGEGLVEIYKEMGVAQIISGGQTMNPSAEDIIKAINKTPANEIIILPNNSNIILAAQQAQKLVEKQVYIVETKYMLQGISAMMGYNPDSSGEENFEAMTEAFQYTKTAGITYAVRDSHFGDQEIHKDDILGLIAKDIAAVTATVEEAVTAVLDKMVDDESGLITILYGEDVAKADAEVIVSIVREKYPDVEVEMQFGGQAVYYYLISVE